MISCRWWVILPIFEEERQKNPLFVAVELIPQQPVNIDSDNIMKVLLYSDMI